MIEDDDYEAQRRVVNTHALCWMVTHRVGDHPLVQLVGHLVDKLVAEAGLNDSKACRRLREQYIKNLCDAVRCLGHDWFDSLMWWPGDLSQTVDQAAPVATPGTVLAKHP